MKSHEYIEKRLGVLAALVVVVISFGGLAEIVPLFHMSKTTTPIEGMKPGLRSSLKAVIFISAKDAMCVIRKWYALSEQKQNGMATTQSPVNRSGSVRSSGAQNALDLILLASVASTLMTGTVRICTTLAMLFLNPTCHLSHGYFRTH